MCFSLGIHAQTTSLNQNKTSSIKHYKVIEGRQNATFKLNNKQTIDVSISVPKIQPHQKIPLIIALHWAGGTNAYIDYSECLAFPALEFLNGIIIAPSDDGLHWITAENESKLLQLIKSVKKHWPIDDTKIIITGYSNGGIASWAYAEKYPEVFCATIPIAGSYTASKIEIPTYVIHGKNDELFNAYRTQNILSQSINKGSNITLNLIEQSHYEGCSYVKALQDIAKLMQTEVLD
nr:dienelactone hydrolase family protein [uncultured Psychroserpens sp.]